MKSCPRRWNEQYWSPSQISRNLSVFEVGPHKLGFKEAVLLRVYVNESVIPRSLIIQFKRRHTDKWLSEFHDKLFLAKDTK